MAASQSLSAAFQPTPPAFHQLRAELERLTSAEDLNAFFAEGLDDDVLAAVVRNPVQRRRLLGLIHWKAEAFVRSVLAPSFWSRISDGAGGHRSWEDVFENALTGYYNGVVGLSGFLERLLVRTKRGGGIQAERENYRLRDLVISAELSLTQHDRPSLSDLVVEFYGRKLQLLLNSQGIAQEIHSQVINVRNALQFLNLEGLHENALRTVIVSNLESYLVNTLPLCSGRNRWCTVHPGFEGHGTALMKRFLEHVVHPQAVPKWGETVRAIYRGTLGRRRFGQLFDMAAEFPSSRPAVSDVSVCLELGHFMRSEFVRSFEEQLHERLLQAGTATGDIVEHFLSTTQMFAEIDPTGLLMAEVSETYKTYLRDRIDTMKSIVAVIADTRLEHPCTLEEVNEISCDPSSDEDNDPDKAIRQNIDRLLDAQGDVIMQQHKSTSVYSGISTLVGIYSSPDGFVREYKRLLGEKLMTKSDYDCDRECRVFDVLKKKFGEASMQDCEIMLNDAIQSRILNRSLEEESERIVRDDADMNDAAERPLAPLSALMIAYLRWPKPKEPEITLPSEIRRVIDVYSAQFALKKAPRTLTWNTGCGIVELDVKIGHRTQSFRVSPVLATLLYHFGHRDSIEESDLAGSIGLDVATVKAKMAYWINNGILEESIQDGAVWYRRQTSMEHTGTPIPEDSDEDGQPRTSTGSDVAKYSCFRTYILEFLRHVPEGATLGEVHRHLEKFVKQHRFDLSQSELAEYMDTLAMERAIDGTGGFYKSKR